MYVWKISLTVLISSLLLACSGDESKEIKAEVVKVEVIKEQEVINQITVSMPVNQVPVYPLGEPGLTSYFSNLERDNAGIVVLDRHGNNRTYEPGMIAKYVMASYRRYLNNANADILADALKHSDWLVENIHCDNKLGYWLLEAPLDSLVVWESPFKSAMTNGLSIFALAQMLAYTEQPEKYLATIECALKAYQYDISEGGVSSITDEYTWFEEYAMESRSKVLNGGLFALTGVWVAKEYLNSSVASELFNKMLAAVELRLNEYDYGHTSLYHTSIITGTYRDYGRPVHGSYNEIHALQLQWLYSETGHDILLNYAKTFYGYGSYEIESVLKNKTALAKMVDPYKYHSYEVFTALDEFEVDLKPKHALKEIHLFYYGNHDSLPRINVTNDTTSVLNIEPAEIRYFQDGKHHTSVAIYEVASDVEINDIFTVEFVDYTYTDNYNRNLLRQVEVVTDDNDVYFNDKYERWANQGNWSRIYK